MEAKTVRLNLEEIRGALARNEAERDVLVTLLKGYEGWLRLNPEALDPPQMSLPLVQQRLPGPTIPGTPSMRGAVLRVLREARGEPLHSKEILRRVTALGAVSNAKNPLGMMDLLAYSLAKSHPMKKVGPRTWRYYADDAKETEDGASM